ncbi:MAG: AMP-binding protein [Bryobacterales bacterium]
MQTLLEVFARMDRLGRREAVRWNNGYRTRVWSYAELCARSRAFAGELERRGIGRGDCVLVWGENRPEWLAAFWGCVLRGATVVPVDFHSSAGLAESIAARTRAKLCLVGDETKPGDGLGETMRLAALEELPEARPAAVEVSPDDAVEIVFTSGSTSEPKGVVHRHRNICANLSGVAKEMDRYGWATWPFQPIRCLDLLPLSHLFGQTMGLYIPPLLGGSVVFSSELGGTALLDLIRQERISVATGVPAMLSGLKERVEKELDGPPAKLERKGWASVFEAWWRHRKIHSRTGWKFWAFVVGGARLDEELETFWKRLGFAVVQGYGLTEASPVVALNHPFSTRSGSLGKPLPGQEVKLAPDGEILVRGASVASEYYGGSKGEEGSTRFEGGWLHTGDLGEMDAEGRLYYRGRKRDLIVKPDGLNVHPQDVEKALVAEAGVREACVIGTGAGRVHAALVLADGADAGALVGRANGRLEPYQRVQEWSLWDERDLPRTASTLKIRRGELAEMVAARTGAEPPRKRSEVEELLGRDLPQAAEDARLEEDLGLSSLERVELLSRIEDKAGTTIDEERFARARTVADLEAMMASERKAEELGGPPQFLLEPRWTRWLPVRALRRAALDWWILAMFKHYLPLKVEGIENLEALDGPAIFAANHSSHLDTAAVLAALPKKLRRRLAPAMSQDYFGDFFKPRPGVGWKLRAEAGLSYLAALTLFNAFPLPQKMAGARRALRYAGEMVDAGYSVLIYPEGTRTEDGKILHFQPGVGLMAQRLGVPVVPVRLRGLFEVYSVHHEWPEVHEVGVSFGEPLRFAAHEGFAEVAAQVEAAVRKL